MTPPVTPAPPAQPLAEVVHENIKAELVKAGKTRPDLQRALEMKPQAMQRRYSQSVEWSVSEIEKAALWLGIPETTLFTRPE